MFSVTFEYDENARKWEVFVDGAVSPTEAVQGFCAVLLTARDAIVSHETNRAEWVAEGRYKISVGVLPTTNGVGNAVGNATNSAGFPAPSV